MRVSRRGNSTETTGDRIRRARMEGGLSQKELAERLGVSSPTVGQWESGRRNPKDETLQRIAAALGVDVYELKPPYLLNGDIMREWLSPSMALSRVQWRSFAPIVYTV